MWGTHLEYGTLFLLSIQLQPPGLDLIQQTGHCGLGAEKALHSQRALQELDMLGSCSSEPLQPQQPHTPLLS